MGLINYLGESKLLKRICELLNVTDVQDGEGHSLVDENGIAIVTGGGGASALNDLSDVNITSAADYQTLIYDSTDQEWQNGSLAFTNLSDVNISSPSNGQVLKYNSTAGEWRNTDASWLSLASGGTVKGDTTFRKTNLTADAQITLTVGGKNSSSDTYGTDGIFVLANKSGSRIFLYPPTISFNYQQVYFPNKSGTIAMASDIPSDFVPASTGGTFEGDIVIDEKDGTTSVVGQSKIVLGNSTLQTADENSKGVVRLYARGSKYVDICASDGSAISDNRELNVPDKDGTILLDADVYTTDVPAYTPSGGTAYSAAQMGLYVHNNLLSDGQKVCAKVSYGTNDMFLVGYKFNSSRGRYLYATRTNDAVFSLRITGTKAAAYTQLTAGSATNITID